MYDAIKAKLLFLSNSNKLWTFVRTRQISDIFSLGTSYKSYSHFKSCQSGGNIVAYIQENIVIKHDCQYPCNSVWFGIKLQESDMLRAW